MGKKRQFEVENKYTNEFSLPAKYLATSHVRAHEKRLIVVLEGAQLETVKVSCGWKRPMYRFWWFPLGSRWATHSNCWIATITSTSCEEITKIRAHADRTSPIRHCWCSSIRRWIERVCCRSTFTHRRTFWSKSIRNVEFQELSNVSAVWWVSDDEGKERGIPSTFVINFSSIAAQNERSGRGLDDEADESH